MINKVCKNFLSLVLAGWLIGVAAPAVARPIAYVTNQNSNTVSVIDITSNTVIATVPVDKNPSVVAISPDGAFAYVTNAVSDSVSVIAIATNTVVETVAVGRVPEGIAVTPDGAFVYVAINDFNEFDGTVSVISTETDTVVATVRAVLRSVGPSVRRTA